MTWKDRQNILINVRSLWAYGDANKNTIEEYNSKLKTQETKKEK